MRNGFLAAIATLLGCAGLTLAQPAADPVAVGTPGSTEGSKPAPAAPPACTLPPPSGPGTAAQADTAGKAASLAAPDGGLLACCGEPCSGNSRLWVSGEYLLWQVKDAPVDIPLATTGSTNFVTGLGVLGHASTVVLFGASPIEEPTFSGARVAAGYWFDSEPACGFEGSFFFLGKRSLTPFHTSSDPTGSPVLTVPLLSFPLIRTANGFQINPKANPIESGALLSFPGAFTGSMTVSYSTELWGAEANGVANLIKKDAYTLGILGGFRYLDLREDLTISYNTTLLDRGIAFFEGKAIGRGNQLSILDDFHTRNQFYGGQLGAQGDVHYGRFSLEGVFKMALGLNHETVSVNGTTTLLPPTGSSATAPGGLFALPSNIGSHGHDQYAVIPEATVTARCGLTRHLTALVGYSFLYSSAVVRPGNELDRTINPTQLVTSAALSSTGLIGPVAPVVNFNKTELNKTDFWAQGVNFGLELSY
jgi:hypothetical protein